MSTDQYRTIVRPRNPGDIAEALRFLVNPYPTNSVVILGLHGDARAIQGIMRFTIPDDRDDWEQAAIDAAHEYILDTRADGRVPEQVILSLIRDPEPGASGQDVHDDLLPLAIALGDSFDQHGFAVAECFSISAGRWRCCLCNNPECCSPDGNPINEAGPVTTAMVYAGMSPSRERADIEAELRPLTPDEGSEAQLNALEEAQLSCILAVLRGEVTVVREDTATLVQSAMTAVQDDVGGLSDKDAAYLITGLQDRSARDHALMIKRDQLECAHRLWRELVRRCVPPYEHHAPAPLTLLGWTAWISGDIATARVAFTRAAEIDPEYALARLFLDAVNQGFDVEEMRAHFLEVAASTK